MAIVMFREGDTEYVKQKEAEMVSAIYSGDSEAFDRALELHAEEAKKFLPDLMSHFEINERAYSKVARESFSGKRSPESAVQQAMEIIETARGYRKEIAKIDNTEKNVIGVYSNLAELGLNYNPDAIIRDLELLKARERENFTNLFV